MVVEVFSMNFVNFLILVEDVAVEVVEAKEVLPNDIEPCDVYVAINAQYHDYAKLFEEWFGGNIDNKVFESAITFWFKDVDFDGDKVWEYFHMNN